MRLAVSDKDLASLKQLIEEESAEVEGTTVNLNGLPSETTKKQCFIPMLSAFDVQQTVSDQSLYQNFTGNTNHPFAEIFAPTNNLKHVEIDIINFLLQQIKIREINLPLTLVGQNYNFANLNKTTLSSVEIGVGATVRVNGSGLAGLGDEPNTANVSGFEVITGGICGPATVNVNNGGTLRIGEIARVGTLKITNGSVVRVFSGAALIVDDNSHLVVENGGKLIIEAGANINLPGTESKIIVKNGGELIIKGDFTSSGNGYFSFENGNKLTLDTDWTLIGSGKTSRLINVENNAEIKISNGRRWTIKEALVRKVGASGSNDVLVFENGSTLWAENVTFDDQVSGGSFSFVADYEAIDLDNNPNDMEFSFRNCDFGNTSYAVILGGFDNGNRFDFRNLNVEFVNSTFTNCRQAAYYTEQGFITTFDNCTILGSGIDVQRMYWLQMRNTTMRGGAIGANQIGVKLSFSIHNWIRENCIISGYATGIDALTGINGNIVLSDRMTIQSCGTAIKQNGGADYGLLYMDCTAILENQNGITGTNILLSAYSRGNTANIYTKPVNNSTSLFF